MPTSETVRLQLSVDVVPLRRSMRAAGRAGANMARLLAAPRARRGDVAAMQRLGRRELDAAVADFQQSVDATYANLGLTRQETRA